MVIALTVAVLMSLGAARVHAPPTQASRDSQPRDSSCVVYANKQYGFTFCLPESWAGFTVDSHQWDGRVLEGDTARPPQVLHGPELCIRHPLWTAAHPRQDIPILIFTHTQWGMIERGGLAVSAAPIGPTELGRNTWYVFALPPRYDFALLPGWEEVRTIVDRRPLHPL